MDDSADKPQTELESDIRQMAAVTEVTAALMGIRELDTLLREAACACVRQFDLTEARIYLLDGAKRQGALARRTGTDVAAENIIPTGRAVVLDRAFIASEDRLPPDVRAAIALPMQIEGQTLGMLDLRSDTPGVFRPEGAATLQAMADQVAAAIENIRLYEAARNELHGIERLTTNLADEPAEQAPAGAGSRYSIPLKVGGQTVGTIELAPGEDGAPPDEAMRRLVETVARRVTEALEMSRVDEPAGEIVLRDEELSRLSAELQAATDVDAIMAAAVREASRMLGTERAFITLSLPSEREEPKG